MTEAKKKNKRKDFAVAIAGLASVVGVIVTSMVVITASSHHPKTATSTADLPDWAKIATDKLHAAGFGFATAQFTDGIISITGDAPNADARTNAFEAAKKAVLEAIAEKKLDGKSGVLAFDNSITVKGKEVEYIPDAAAALGAKPEEESCQTAYNTLLKGRVINFNSASAIISADSEPLLNNLSDVAIKCVDYKVEVGGHTDTKGDAGANLALSERRAQAVADYLVRKGVNASEIAIKGYGETQPIDVANTAEADAKNRRIEFKVSPKAN